MSGADIGLFGEELYEQVLPLHGPDPDGLAHDLIGAWTHGVREVDELVRDSEKGPGWGVILDVDDAPAKGLRWLSQLAGVELRARRYIVPPYLPNANGEAGVSGWTSVAPTGGRGHVAASSEISGGGFQSSLVSVTPPVAGSWRVIVSSSLTGALAASPSLTYGFAATILTDVTPTDAPNPFTLQAVWFDEDFAEIGSVTVDADSTAWEDLGTNTTVMLSGSAIAPNGTAYAGMAVAVTVVDPPDGVVETGEFVIAEAPDGVVPAWPYRASVQRLETETEWAVYARQALREQNAKRRGTPRAILNAVRDTLTGTRYAHLLERVGGNAYALTLITRPSETPDPAVTYAAALRQKPMGMALTHTLTEGVIIDEGTKTIDTSTATIDTATISDVAN
jgi:hypothetical protein